MCVLALGDGVVGGGRGEGEGGGGATAFGPPDTVTGRLEEAKGEEGSILGARLD